MKVCTSRLHFVSNFTFLICYPVSVYEEVYSNRTLDRYILVVKANILTPLLCES